VELKGRAVDTYTPPDDTTLVLICGPDEGKVQLTARRLVDLSGADAERVELSDTELKGEPARLMDEAQAISLFGGARVLRLRVGAEPSQKALKLMAQAVEKGELPGASRVIATAGDLPGRHSLRKALQPLKGSVTLLCYPDSQGDVAALIQEVTEDADVRLTREARDALLERLGTDRAVSRNELDKLCLYAGPGGTVDADTVTALIPGDAPEGVDAAVEAVLAGRAQAADAAFNRALATGVAASTLLRALMRLLGGLHGASLHPDGSAAGLDGLRPRPFGPRRKLLERAMSTARAGFWAEALSRAVTAEAASRQTGAPANDLIRALFLDVARALAARQR
jgi:DNA polymerase-3 subunit delta